MCDALLSAFTSAQHLHCNCARAARSQTNQLSGNREEGIFQTLSHLETATAPRVARPSSSLCGGSTEDTKNMSSGVGFVFYRLVTVSCAVQHCSTRSLIFLLPIFFASFASLSLSLSLSPLPATLGDVMAVFLSAPFNAEDLHCLQKSAEKFVVCGMLFEELLLWRLNFFSSGRSMCVLSLIHI